jgi:hypothetical protein
MPISWKRALVILVSIGLLYVIGIMYIYIFIDNVIFSPKKHSKAYTYNINIPFRINKIVHPNQEYIESLWFEHQSPVKKGVVLYLHGAKESCEYWSQFVPIFTSLGFDVLMPEYRGFGKSPGKTSEFNLYQDALTSYYWLEKIIPSDSILIYGEGIGAVAAANVGSQSTARMVILENPILSIREWIRNRYQALLIYRELKYDFKLIDYLPQCQSTVLSIYSECNEQFKKEDISILLNMMPDPKNAFSLSCEKAVLMGQREDYHKLIEKILSNF